MFKGKKVRGKKGAPEPQNVRSNSNNTMTWQDKQTKNTGKSESITRSKGSLNAENVYNAVILPNRPDYYVEDYEKEKDEIHEFWAEQTVDFFGEISLILQLAKSENKEWEDVVDHPEKYPHKGYPPNVQYLWRAEKNAKPEALPIDVYIDHVMVWIDAQFENENVFPSDESIPFPENFKTSLKKMYQRMFRMFAIVYSNECLMKKKGMEQYLDLAFRNFLYFCWKWDLLADNETKCIESHVKPIRKKFVRDENLYLAHKLPLVIITSKHTKLKE